VMTCSTPLNGGWPCQASSTKKIPIWQWPKCHATSYEETAPTQGRAFKSALGAIKLASSFVLRTSKGQQRSTDEVSSGQISSPMSKTREEGDNRMWMESISRAVAACGRQAGKQSGIRISTTGHHSLPWITHDSTSAMLQSLQSNGPQNLDLLQFGHE
jgi:hypothetical protein